MTISVSGFADLKSRVEKQVKYSTSFTSELFTPWLNEVITDVERAIPLHYCLETREIELTAGGHKILLERLIRSKEHNEKFQVGIKVPSDPNPSPIGKLKDLPIGADVRTYTTADQGVPGCYFPLEVLNDDDKRRPGILLLPPPSTEATHVYVRGYFHPELPDWQSDTTVWLMEEYPDVLIHGISIKANIILRQKEDAAIEQGLYNVALRGDPDTSKNGLLQIMRAADIDDPKDVRMRLVPGVASAEFIGDPDYYHSDSQYYDPNFDYEKQRYLPRG